MTRPAHELRRGHQLYVGFTFEERARIARAADIAMREKAQFIRIAALMAATRVIEEAERKEGQHAAQS